MPHIIVEYTENIQNEANVEELLNQLHKSLISHGDLFSPTGIRSRAIKLTDYNFGDDDAFVHVTLKIISGRSKEVIKTVLDDLFSAIESHFDGVFADKRLSLSLELFELNNEIYRKN